MSPRQQFRRAAIRWVLEQTREMFDGISEREIAWIVGMGKSAVNRHLCRMREAEQVELSAGERRGVRLKETQFQM